MATFFQLTRTNWHHADERDLYYHKTFNFATLKEALPNLLCWADKDEEGIIREHGFEYQDAFGFTRQQHIYNDIRDGQAIIEIRKEKWTAGEDGRLTEDLICRVTLTEVTL